MRFVRVTRSEGETRRLAARLGRVARGGDVVGLRGPLGAGKTRFVQGLARGLGVARGAVTSPTFAIVAEHAGRVCLQHVDLYRPEGDEDLREIGLRDVYAADDAVTAVEWIDRFASARPRDWIEVRIAMGRGSVRRIEARAHGARSRALLAAWRRALR